MLITKVENGNIEKALKTLKRKVISTKQTQELRDRKEFTKPSVEKRQMISKAKYKQSKDL
jgi:small subunit ribosomal protein S21